VFARTSKDSERVLVCALNLSPAIRSSYRVGLPRAGKWKELVNTDSSYYGGTDTGNLGGVQAEPLPWHGQPYSAEITLPPLAGLWLVPDAGV
jgi:1,4-alpha-glucan branching enzyme